jgi:hypothetical protein
MAGMHPDYLSGGSGMFTAPPSNANAALVGQSAPHVGVIGLVVIAVAILVLLDNLGFRFAVTAGKR